MSSLATDRNAGTISRSFDRAMRGATGSSIDAPDWEIVVLSRPGKPPLRFKGHRLTGHHRLLWNGLPIKVALWQQAKKGFVISYSYLVGSRVSDRAIQVSDLDEATDCLENVCASLDTSRLMAGNADRLWLDLQLHLCFRQHFQLLVADVLADWHFIPQLQEPA